MVIEILQKRFIVCRLMLLFFEFDEIEFFSVLADFVHNFDQIKSKPRGSHLF